VVLTMVAGKEIYRGGHLSAIDEDEFRSRLETIRNRIDSLG